MTRLRQGYGAASELMNSENLSEFVERCAEAWCGENAESVASFFAENGSLSVNDGSPAVGRAAIAKEAQSFMTVFPDMIATLKD